MAKDSILVVDDEPGVRTALAGILEDEGFAVTTVVSGEECLEAVKERRFDAVFLDVWLPGIDGLETLTRMQDHREDAEVIMISGHGTIETAVRATKLGAFDFVEKPLSLEKTLLVLRNALRQRRLERRNQALLEQLARDTDILGRSPAAERLRAEVASAASSSAAVLVCGERGSGRETVARRIHLAGPRSGEAFVDVPCGALDRATAESVLFGADGTTGRIRLSEGGSLFLEDVEELDPDLQTRLAAHLGARGESAPDVRLLVSASPDVHRIEPFLRHCLDVLRIHVPPLRERRDDIPLFVERFMRDFSTEYGREVKRLSPGCLAALRAHSWPGNVRELRNLVERLLLLTPGDKVDVADLPAELGGARGPADDLYGEFASLKEGVKAFERYYIRRVLGEERADMAAAAERLGIKVATLRSRMKKLGPV